MEDLKPKISKRYSKKNKYILAVFFFTCIFFWLIPQLSARFGLSEWGNDFRAFLFPKPNDLIRDRGRTNILILGKSGTGFTAPDLTDTIIVVSLGGKPLSVVLISVPRDLWIASIRAKINAAYYWGNRKETKEGLLLAREEVQNITGLTIPYAVVFDFSSFVKLIDILGGVEVDVKNSFTDEKYPLPGKENDLCGGDKTYKCRFETLSFSAGRQWMDGATALKFVRSRNAEGEEGTDIAREARQQLVIAAVKERLTNLKVFLNPKTLAVLWQLLLSSTETNINRQTIFSLARELVKVRSKMTSFVFPSDLIVNPGLLPKYDRQYVFLPKSGDWEEIQTWISLILQN